MVTPPVYGRTQSGKDLPKGQDAPVWLGDLNLDPRMRAAAGAAAQVVQRDQEALVASAWDPAAAANGTRYPYLFPVAATYWSQAAGAVQFIKDKLGGSLAGKKIAYLYFDNPAGHEPMVILDNLKQQEKFELKEFAVPPPGVEMGAQVLDIAQRFKPDFVIMHLFGRSPSVAIKALKGAGYPLSKVIGMVWASAEADIAAAGGWGAAEGYHTIQFAGVGDDYPVRHEIVAWYKAQGKDAPKEMADTVYYNRGLLIAALHVEAIRNALKANGGAQPTGEDVKRGFEAIHDVTLGGLVPPLKLSLRKSRGRRLDPGVQGPGRQVRQGDRLVPRLSRSAHQADRGGLSQRLIGGLRAQPTLQSVGWVERSEIHRHAV